MKPQIALSIDQMHELQSLGLDCSDASMAWCSFYGEETLVTVEFIENVRQKMVFASNPIHSYAYTLEDILIKTPNRIEDGTWISMVFTTPFDETEYVSRMQQAFEAFKWVLQNHPDKIRKI